MHKETQVWTTPLLAPGFDLHENKEKLQEHLIAPAVEAVVNNLVSSHLSSLVERPIHLRDGVPKDGWDSCVRFTHSNERVFSFRNVEKTIGTTSEPNPEFSRPGLTVFSRNCPESAFFSESIQEVVQESIGKKVRIWISVTIPDESVFQTEWFRLA